MRIAFITSSLEPGQDGVGDYSRRLAAECVRQGHPSILMSLNDPGVSQPAFGAQDSEGTALSVLRLPARLPWNERVAKARDWINFFGPDWTSLQFVPFGFQSRGLCFGLGPRLAAISPRAKRHIMFHELWLGVGWRPSLKHRIWGAVQRATVRRLVRRLRPAVQHTQTEPYRKLLAREGIPASVLPLFSNIPRAAGDAWEDVLEPLIAHATAGIPDRNALYLAGIFGAVHPEWRAETAVECLLPLVRRFQKRLVLVFLGKNNLSPAAALNLKSGLREHAVIVFTGEQTSAKISRLLQTLDLGLATTPRQLIQKSGSVAAMLEHGLPVLVTRDDWRLDRLDIGREDAATRLLTPADVAPLSALPVRQQESPVDMRIESVASKMLRDLVPGLINGGMLNEISPACSR